MLRADKVLAAGTWTGAPADSVVLEFDERYRRRFVMTGVGGLAFLLDLPEAAMLRGGDGLRLEDGRLVEVLAAPEPLAEIRAADALALMRLAWHLGNRHLPTEMTPKALRIRRDPVIEDMARDSAHGSCLWKPRSIRRAAPTSSPRRRNWRPGMPITAATVTSMASAIIHTATTIPITGMIIMMTSTAITPIIGTTMKVRTSMPMTIGATIMNTGSAEPEPALLPLMLWLSPTFPVGSFAYSQGLEWAVEAGDVSDARSLGGWLVDLLTFGAPRADAILFTGAFRAAQAGDREALIEANALAVALAGSAERRLETTAQGSAFVAAARIAWDCEPLRAWRGKTASPIRSRSPQQRQDMICRSNCACRP